MNNPLSRMPSPVKRAGAQRYLRLSLLSFAATVILVRLFLALTNYPQLGGGTLHIAHVLWGGLILFVAALLPLLLANRWVYAISGVLSGVGVGLFIDEVGKFITRSNDYFYPPAAPIIYGFFLLVVLLYQEVARPPRADARTELYHALDGLQEVLDHDLTIRERSELEGQLTHVAGGVREPELAGLARVLLAFVRSGTVTTLPDRIGFWERSLQRSTTWLEDHIPRTRFRMALAVGFIAVGLLAFLNLIQWLFLAFSPALDTPMMLIVTMGGVQRSTGGPAWLAMRVFLEWVVGILLVVAGRFLLLRQDWRGLQIGYYGLLLSLTTVNLLVFYFDQFRAVVSTVIQFGLLSAALYYRRQYCTSAAASRPPETRTERRKKAA